MPTPGPNPPWEAVITGAHRLPNRYVIHCLAISTGAFGYSMEEAARVAFQTILEQAPRLRSVRRIRFVLFSEADLKVHERILTELYTC